MKFNGKQETLTKEISVAELLRGKQYDPERVAVEVNESIVPKAAYEKTIVNDGDTVEVVSFVGGG